MSSGEKIRKIFGANIKKYREQKGWNRAELAQKVDVSAAFMTHIERGTRGVSMETIETFAEIFGVPYTALFEISEK